MKKSNNQSLTTSEKKVHIVTATFNNVNKRTSNWTVRIRYNDPEHQNGITYIKATISNTAGNIVKRYVKGKRIDYTGPFGADIEIDYSVNFYLPCIFNSNEYYKYWIDYYASDGTWIDSYYDEYPNAYAEKVFHFAAFFPCLEIDKEKL